jgi:hypothetical protein
MGEVLQEPTKAKRAWVQPTSAVHCGGVSSKMVGGHMGARHLGLTSEDLWDLRQ